MTEIHCADCGDSVRAKRPNTKYCKLCRLYRNVVYIASRSATCCSCESQFAPLHRNDQLCPDCDFLAENNPRGSCAFCEKEDELRVCAGVALCNRCAKTPALRHRVTLALAKKRAARRKANVATEVPA